MESLDCILCGPGPTTPYHRENGYQAVRCSGCGLVFVNPRPTETEMKHLYEGQETKVSLTGLTRGIELARRNARHDLDGLAAFATAGRLLEIGCGGGYFLREAKLRGFDVVGMDITRQFVDFGRDVLGLDVREGTMSTLALPPQSFDVVYHRNVLSHLAYPIEDFRAMRALLRPGGLMVFVTGNVAELPASHWEGTDDLELPDHLFHFGEPTIRTLLARTGFEPVRVQRYALLSQEPLLKRAAGLFARKKPEAPGDASPKATPASIPTTVPTGSLPREVTAFVESFIRYQVGSVLPAAGRRCSLTVVARRVED